MALKLTRDNLRAAYAYLSETEPFSRWNLPDADDVTFKVARSAAYFGWHTFDGSHHVIAISGATVHDTATLLATMAHELIHVHEHHAKQCRRAGGHSIAFHRWAAQVCRAHGFEPKGF
jgi:hypothetical protein